MHHSQSNPAIPARPHSGLSNSCFTTRTIYQRLLGSKPVFSADNLPPLSSIIAPVYVLRISFEPEANDQISIDKNHHQDGSSILILRSRERSCLQVVSVFNRPNRGAKIPKRSKIILALHTAMESNDSIQL
jgi:hypothetical protein